MRLNLPGCMKWPLTIWMMCSTKCSRRTVIIEPNIIWTQHLIIDDNIISPVQNFLIQRQVKAFYKKESIPIISIAFWDSQVKSNNVQEGIDKFIHSQQRLVFTFVKTLMECLSHFPYHKLVFVSWEIYLGFCPKYILAEDKEESCTVS